MIQTINVKCMYNYSVTTVPHEIQITTVSTGCIFLQIPHLLYTKYTVIEKKL